MNSLGDALRSAYDSDERQARGLDRGPHRTVVAIRRRRTARAAGTGTAAAVAIGALGAVWLFAPGGRGFAPGQPAPSTQCTDAQLYLPANPDALGDSDFLYRAYIDLRQDSPTHGVVVVRKDGTLVRVEPDADGNYTYLDSLIISPDMPDELRYQPLVEDFFEGGGGGDIWDGVSPVTDDYEWTVDVPAGAPAGVDTVQLSSSLRVAMGLGGSGYDSSFVPHGAVTDAIITTLAGETEVSRVGYGGPSNTQDTSTDVASIALRVSELPGGDTYTLTATHHALNPALTACVVFSATPSPSATPTPSGTPSSEPGVSEGPEPGSEPLSGPESTVFACGIPLAADLEGDLGLEVSWESGLWPAAAAASEQFDFGAGGVLARGALPDGGPPHGEIDASHWASSSDETSSFAIFDEVVAVKDGMVVGTIVDTHGTTGTDSINFAGKGLDEKQWVDIAIADVDARMVACPQFAVDDLEGAQTVLLLGTGAVGGPYQFAWTPIARP